MGRHLPNINVKFCSVQKLLNLETKTRCNYAKASVRKFICTTVGYIENKLYLM